MKVNDDNIEDMSRKLTQYGVPLLQYQAAFQLPEIQTP